MGALDKLRSTMQLELVEIIERVGVTCVMVTHDQEEAMTMAGGSPSCTSVASSRSAARWTYRDPSQSAGVRVHRQRQPV